MISFHVGDCGSVQLRALVLDLPSPLLYHLHERINALHVLLVVGVLFYSEIHVEYHVLQRLQQRVLTHLQYLCYHERRTIHQIQLGLTASFGYALEEPKD